MTFMRKLVSPRGVFAARIDRYILRQLVLGLLAITCGLVALIWLTQSLRFVELVVNRGLSLRVFVQLTSLLIPSFVAVILPITTFVVVQFVYHAAGRRPGVDGDARGRTVAGGPGAAGAGAGLDVGGAVLRAQPVAGAVGLRGVPRIQFRDPQPRRRLPAAGGGVHPGFRRPHRLCPRSRTRRHPARHPGGRRPQQGFARHHPGRAWPADARWRQPAGAAGERQPAGDRPPHRPPACG